jgi:hypothetical protein
MTLARTLAWTLAWTSGRNGTIQTLSGSFYPNKAAAVNGT